MHPVLVAASTVLASLTLAVPADSSRHAAPAPAAHHAPSVHGAQAARTTPRAALPTEFRIASFNVLGASHTRHSATYRSGSRRMRGTVRLLERNAVDVVGFQELQAGQLQRLLALTGGRYDVYPGLSPSLTGRVDSENSIAWDTTVWEPVEEHTVSIPYFGGRLRAMPVALLRNRATGMTAWVANVHTPATNRRHRGQDGWRRQAIADMAALATQLQATGIPVFLTGDYNERADAFCPITGTAPMLAARGGTNLDGMCDPMHPWYVDWVFGSRGVSFTDYAEIRGRLDRRTSDHPMIVATAHVDPALFPQAVAPPLPPAN